MNNSALYPGSFDPITKGHLDIIKRAYNLFDELTVGVFLNSSKKYWFNSEERKKMIEEVLKSENIKAKVKIFDGLLVDFIKNEKIDILIRGLRAVSDYEYELQFTLTNETLAKSDFETIFMSASREYLYLSSSLVKEIAVNGGELEKFVHKCVEQIIKNKIESNE